MNANSKDSLESELREMYKKGLLTDSEFQKAIVSLHSHSNVPKSSVFLNKLKNRKVLALSISAILLTIFSIWFFFFRVPENYLIVGKPATITTKSGIYIRTEPNMVTGRLIGLIPYKQTFDVLEEGKEQTIYGIRSRWYLVRYKGKVGWAWGGLAKHE